MHVIAYGSGYTKGGNSYKKNRIVMEIFISLI